MRGEWSVARWLRCLVLVLLGCVAACDSEDRSPVDGSWQGILPSQFGEMHSRLQFNADGSYLWQTEFPDFDREFRKNNFIPLRLLASEIAGRYRIEDDELVFSPVTRQGQLDKWPKDLPPDIAKYEYVYPFTIEDDQLILIDENGDEMRFDREKGFFVRWFARLTEALGL